MTDPALAAESNNWHSRILRVTLSVEESAVFWERARPDETSGQLNVRAFEERWYGSRSEERVRKLHEDFVARYSFPGTREALAIWAARGMPAEARRLVAHWHLQLADPLYRLFTGTWLVERRATGHTTVDRDVVARWLQESLAADYSAATRQMFAGKLLTAAGQAGLLTAGTVRTIRFPSCPLEPLGYLLYLLRAVSFEGSFHDNPYLRSMDMVGPRLEGRLVEGQLAGWWRYARMGELVEMQWTWPDVVTWRQEVR